MPIAIRINRIFEGVNEINRLIITGWLLKRAVAGQLPLLAAIKHLMDEVSGPSAPEDLEGPLAAEQKMLSSAKKLSLFAAGAASQKYGQGLTEQQETLGALADCIMEVYALESCLLRAGKLLANRGASGARQAVALTQYYAVKSLQTVELAARKVFGAVAEGDMQRTQVAILRLWRSTSRRTPSRWAGKSPARCWRRGAIRCSTRSKTTTRPRTADHAMPKMEVEHHGCRASWIAWMYNRKRPAKQERINGCLTQWSPNRPVEVFWAP